MIQDSFITLISLLWLVLFPLFKCIAWYRNSKFTFYGIGYKGIPYVLT